MPLPLTLHPSPLTVLRAENGLTMAEAAQRLGVSTLSVARVERDTRRIPGCARRYMRAKLGPQPRYVQLSIFDYLAEIEGGAH